jgi:nucleotide-binding universal stress UspA family protein
VDGSPGSRVALEAAVRAADLRGAVLRVVVASVPEDEMGAWGNGAWAAVPPPDPERVRAAASDIAERMVKDVVAELGDQLRSTPAIDVEVRSGHPARVLLDAARDADQLVVGHRGRGAVAGFLLGSVSLHCVTAAPCPVTVVPQPAPDDQP